MQIRDANMIEEINIYADPCNELPLKTAKYFKQCTDLHLAGKNISHLRDFEKFVNVYRLFLNDNRIFNLDGLRENFRIKFLFLHNNRLRKLDPGVLEQFTFLEHLTLNGNYLDDLAGVVDELRSNRNLKVLDLYDNPIAQEDNYRFRVINELPFVTVLDRHKVTPEERLQAKQFKARMERLQNINSPQKIIQLPPSEEEEREMKQKRLKIKNICKRIKDRFTASRSFPERSWMVYDKRDLGLTDERRFWEVLKQHGIEQILTEEEKIMLIERYKAPTNIPAISSTGTIMIDAVDYRKFCKDIVPLELRAKSDSWTFEQVPEISSTTLDLQKYVQMIKQKEREADELSRRTKLLGGSSPGIIGFGDKTGPRHKCEAHGLDPWMAGELGKVIGEMEEEHGLEAIFTREQVAKIFAKMKLMRKVPEWGAREAVNKLFKVLGVSTPHTGEHSAAAAVVAVDETHASSERIPSVQLRNALGCSLHARKPVTISEPAAGGKAVPKGKGPAVSPAPVPTSLADDLHGQPTLLLKWRDLQVQELSKVGHKVHEEGTSMLDKLLRLGPKDDPSALFAKTMQCAVDSTRLGAHFVRPSVTRDFIPPHEVIRSAAPRADVIVLPNLRGEVVTSPVQQQQLRSHRHHSQHDKEHRNAAMLSKTGMHSSLAREPKVAKGWHPATGTIVIG